MTSFDIHEYMRRCQKTTVPEAEIVNAIRDAPPILQIGSCDGLNCLGTIYIACYQGWKMVLRHLLSTIPIDIQRETLSSANRHSPNTPLHAAVWGSHTECLPILMEMQCDVYTKTFAKLDFTPRRGMIRPEVVDDVLACAPFVSEAIITTVLGSFLKATLELYDIVPYEGDDANMHCIFDKISAARPGIFTEPLPVPVYESYFMRVCTQMRIPTIVYVIDNCITEKERGKLLGHPRNALHVLACSYLVHPPYYADKITTIASFLPEWVREYDDHGRRPCDVEERHDIDHTILQTMSAKDAM